MSDPILERLGPVPAPPTLLPNVLAALGLVPDRFVVRPSPVGDVLVAYNDEGISACLVVAGRTLDDVAADFAARFRRSCEADPSPPAPLVESIDAVLGGAPSQALIFDLRSASGFQRAVLDKAAEIPAGEVRPYGWIAAEIGKPAAVRAVGTALGRNPVPLLIPCHRVVRTDGRIGDYAFGSPAKRAVLIAEGIDPDELERLAARGVRFVGDPATGVFCHPTCAAVRPFGSADRVEFRTVDSATSAGLRACDRCRPLAGATSSAA